MKYIIVIAFMACGYAQYPRLKTCNGKIVSYYLDCDSFLVLDVSSAVYPINYKKYSNSVKPTIVHISPNIDAIVFDTVPVGKPQVFYGIAGIQKEPFDSAKYYFKKYILYKKKGDTVRAKKYKLLLDKLKK